jgi:hypothetical protein
MRSCQSPIGSVASAVRARHLTAHERLEEIAELLAASVLRARTRLRAPRGSTAEQVRVDFSPERSGHVAPSRVISTLECVRIAVMQVVERTLSDLLARNDEP